MTQIRPATTEDILRCREIAEAAYLPHVAEIGRRPMPMDEDFAQAVSLARLWVAETGPGLAGYVVAYPKETAWLLENVAVDPGFQGQGIGRALIGHVEARAAQTGASHVNLYTNARMHRNLALYPALGYREVDRARQDGFDRVFFQKTL